MADAPPASRRPSARALFARTLPRESASIPTTSQKVDLMSDHSQHAYTRLFERAEKSFFYVGVIMRNRSDSDTIGEVEAILDAKLDAIAKWIDDELARLEVLATENGVAVEVQYSKPLHTTTVINSPRSGRLLFLIGRFDKMQIQLDMLHLTGVIATKDYANSGYASRRRLVKLINEIIHLSVEAFKAQTRQIRSDAARRRLAAAPADDIAPGAEGSGSEGSEDADPTVEDEPADEPASASEPEPLAAVSA